MFVCGCVCMPVRKNGHETGVNEEEEEEEDNGDSVDVLRHM